MPYLYGHPSPLPQGNCTICINDYSLGQLMLCGRHFHNSSMAVPMPCVPGITER